jgi:putative transposase
MFKDQLKSSTLVETINVASSTWYDHQLKSTRVKEEDLRHQNKGRPVSQMTQKFDGTRVSNLDVIELLKKYRSHEFYTSGGGYRKLTQLLKKDHQLIINKKKVYRLCQQAQILLPLRNKKTKRRAPISCNRVVTAPFQLWELDIKYGYIHGEKRFFFVMAIIDVYLRSIMGYHIGLQCLGQDLVRTLSLALKKMNIDQNQNLVIRMDNGPQMTCNQMLSFAEQNRGQILHELIPLQMPNKNAHIESFYSIIEMECFRNYNFETYKEYIIILPHILN